jgi:cell division septum initiation protein DivIVA
LVRDLEMTKHGFAEGDVDQLQDKIAATTVHTISTKQPQQQPVVG